MKRYKHGLRAGNFFAKANECLYRKTKIFLEKNLRIHRSVYPIKTNLRNFLELLSFARKLDDDNNKQNMLDKRSMAFGKFEKMILLESNIRRQMLSKIFQRRPGNEPGSLMFC